MKPDEEPTDRTKKEGIYFTFICKTNNFFDHRDHKVPEEFNTKEVDITSNTHEAFDENNNHQSLTDRANETFNKHKSNCNNTSTKIHLSQTNHTNTSFNSQVSKNHLKTAKKIKG